MRVRLIAKFNEGEFHTTAQRLFPGNLPPSNRSLLLECAACGHAARYRVGTVLISPRFLEACASRPENGPLPEIDPYFSFTAYLRCRKCKATPLWKLTDRARQDVFMTLTAARLADGAAGIRIAENFLYDRTPVQSPAHAEAILRERIAARPGDAKLWLKLGNVLKNAGQPRPAFEAYQQAIRLDALNLDAHQMLACLHEERGATEQAAEHWKESLRAATRAAHLPRRDRLDAVSVALEHYLELGGDMNSLIAMTQEATAAAQPTLSGAIAKPSQGRAAEVIHLMEFDLGDSRTWRKFCGTFLGEPMVSKRELKTRERLALHGAAR